MRLTSEDGRTWDDPTLQTIEVALSELGKVPFFILDRDDGTFIQTSGDRQGNCDLEYSEGSDDTHFRCTNDTLPVQDIIAVFKEYAAGSDTWRQRFDWKLLSETESYKPVDPSPWQNQKKGCLSLVLIILTIVVLALWRLC